MDDGMNHLVDVLEECVNRVVVSIEKTMSVIKGVDDFSTTTTSTSTKTRAKKRQQVPLDQVNLTGILKTNGIFDHVKNTIVFVQEKLSVMDTRRSVETTTTLPQSPDRTKEVELHTADGSQNDGRMELINCILIPLLDALATCYHHLDQIPQPPPPPPKIDHEPKTSNDNSKKKPTPPRGMLSIQNYTDIAAMLEFTVCTSLLPCLEKHVMTSVKDRAQYLLPKSLAGRLSRISLLWGTAIVLKTTTTASVSQEEEQRKRAMNVVELLRTVQVLGNIVLLDRFRPMLLPRHLADIYAGLFQAEALDRNAIHDPLVAKIASCLLSSHDESSTNTFSISSTSSSITSCAGATSLSSVDSFHQARALQTLLLRGKQAPLWLRKRTSTLLTLLATKDLAAVIHVFVPSVSQNNNGNNKDNDMTGAAKRLATALINSIGITNANHKSQSVTLLRQLVQQLDIHDMEQMTPFDFAGALTVWAFLDQLPDTKQQMIQEFVTILVDGVVIGNTADLSTGQSSSTCLHRMIRRVIVLLSVIPPSSQDNARWVGDLMFSSLWNSNDINIVDLLIRVASITTIEERLIKTDAITAIRMMCRVLDRMNFRLKGMTVDGNELLSVVLMHAITTTQWDIAGHRYELPRPEDDAVTLSKSDATLDMIRVHQRHIDESMILVDVEKRAKLVVLEVICFLSNDSSYDKETSTEPSNLPQRFFQHMLLVIFALTQNQELTSNARLGVMITLPLMCEHCPPERLLLGATSDASGILGTFNIVLDCAAASLDSSFQQTLKSSESGILQGFNNARNLLLTFVPSNGSDEHLPDHDKAANELDEMIFSTASIAVSLLTAMLELGATERNAQELALLEAARPSLQVLSSTSLQNRSSDVDITKLKAEIAEMASHAAVLIASLKVPPLPLEQPTVADGTKTKKSVSMIISEAEEKIASEHPAVRAQGVVSLRHLVRGFLHARGEVLPSKALIIEVESSSELVGSRSQAGTLDKILRVALTTLSDSESYVYLAGIQTIVAVADVNPELIISRICYGVCTGGVRFNGDLLEDVQLSLHDRVKLAEALIFVVRRRGPAIDRYVSQMLSILTFGEQEVGDRLVEPQIIQEQTHNFFITDTEDVNVLTAPSDRLDAKTLRVKTGGPIFECELGNVVRSSCISVVAEIVSVALPNSVVPFVPELVRLVSTALHLDESRPVRRAAAQLAVSLYEAVLRDDDVPSVDRSLAVALVKANEELLKDTLIVSMGPRESSPELYDPSTSARCEEALRARDLVQGTGVFVAASLHLEALRRDEEDHVTSLVKQRLASGQLSKIGSQ